MADELEPVNQVFTADMEPWIREVREGYDEAQRFAEENRVAADDVQELGRDSTRAADEIRDFAQANKLAIQGLRSMRDEAVQDGEALNSLRDHEMEAAHEADALRTQAMEAGSALGHLRDEAAEASHEVKNLGQQSEETAAKLDLMGLSGASTLSSMGPLVGIIGALVVAAAAAAPAVVAMGLGIGAFAGFAIPTIKQVTGALKDNKTQLAALPAPIRDVVNQVKSLETEYKNISKSFEPAALHVFSQFLQIAQSILPKLVPLANQGAIAFSHIATAISQGLDSAGFASFLHTMTALVVPATDAIIHLGGALTGVLGQALVALAPLAAPFINFVAGLVKALGGPLVAALHVVVSLFMGLATAIAPLLPGISKLATLLINDIGAGFQSFIPILTQVIQILGGALLRILTDLEPIFANLLTPNSGFMLALGLIPGLLHLILPLFETLASILGHPLFAQLAVDALTLVVAFKGLMAIIGILRGAFIGLTAVMDTNPIFLIITAVALLVLVFITLWQHCEGFRNFWKGLWNDILSAAAPVIAAVKNAIADLTAFWNAHWNEISKVLKVVWVLMSGVVHVEMAIMSATIRAALAVIKAAWELSWHVMQIVVTTVFNVIKAIVTGVMQTISGIITAILDVIHGHWSAAWHALVGVAQAQMQMVASVIRAIGSGFINLLYQAGRFVIQGLINGVESMVGAVVSIAQSIGSTISSAFSGILHIFSPSQVFYQHGRNTMLGYINAVTDMIPTLRAVMTQAASVMLPSRLVPSQLFQGTSASSAPLSPGSVGAAAAGGGSGNLIVNVDGKKLFEILQSQLYQYNVRNSGQVTGVVKPV